MAKLLTDYQDTNYLQLADDPRLSHVPESAKTPDFLYGIQEGYRIGDDRAWMRLAAAITVAFAFGLMMGSLLP